MKLLTLGGFKNVTVKHQLFELSVVWSYYFTFFCMVAYQTCRFVTVCVLVQIHSAHI